MTEYKELPEKYYVLQRTSKITGPTYKVTGYGSLSECYSFVRDMALERPLYHFEVISEWFLDDICYIDELGLIEIGE